MRLGLHTSRKPWTDDRGVVRINGLEMTTVDLDTGDRLENQSGMIWTPGSLLMEPLEDGLFSKEHFDPDKDYLVVVVECENAVGVDGSRMKL